MRAHTHARTHAHTHIREYIPVRIKVHNYGSYLQFKISIIKDIPSLFY